MLCFRKFPVAKKFMDKRGGDIKIFRRKFVGSQYQKISLGNFLVCHFFAVSQKFKLKRVMSRFSAEFFRLIVLKDFVGEPFCAVFQKISSCQILRVKGGGE